MPGPSQERGPRVRIMPPLVFVLGAFLGEGLRRLGAPAAIPVGRGVAIAAGVLAMTAGAFLAGWAEIQMFRNRQNPLPWKPAPELIARGPYRFTRNPMYVGMTALQVGLGLALDNLWIALLTAPALLAVHLLAVLPEERYLSQKFGEGYRSYLSRVRRYL